MNLPVAGLSAAAMPAFAAPADRWDAAHAAALTGEQLLLYRSNLLGSDLSITNFGGGNTSAKLPGTDPLSGDGVEVLWVKGSGGDIGSMGLDGFATLYLDRVRSLERHFAGDDDAMVPLQSHCTFGLNPRAASIDTPLHGLLPFAHVDHLHPDAVIALAAAAEGQTAVAELWQGAVGWLPWQRPGFALGLKLRDHVAAHPHQRGVVLAGHGLICWGETAAACYHNSISLIGDAARYLNDRTASHQAFGGQAQPPLPAAERRAVLRALLPRLRGKMGHKTADVRDDAATLAFVCGADMPRLAALGTSCPDHFLRTKIRPLVLGADALTEDAALAAAVAAYRDEYAAYYQRCAGPADPAMRDANPVIVLVPGIGRIALAANRTTARLAAEFYGNAINVMYGAERCGGYQGLDEREAFAIEYWALEEAKLQRMPPPPPLDGRIALVTGAAGGIGAATARRLLAEGACVLLTDRDADALAATAAGLAARFGADRVAHALSDVTDETAVSAAADACVLAFGGLDILVANAGLASAASIEDTTLDIWQRNHDVLAQGVFLCARAAFPLMRAQGGGSIVVIGSKNALAATPGASAYASAKAAALHLARCLALEGAPFGIRVNTVNPDAVIKGSGIWDGAWRRERAGAYGIDPGAELEAHYRNRSLLKRDVLPEDVAEAVLFLASDKSAKSTGNIINVDAGNAQAFTR